MTLIRDSNGTLFMDSKGSDPVRCVFTCPKELNQNITFLICTK